MINEGCRFIIWKHDPCPEGGYSVHGYADTLDRAVEDAEKLFKDEVKEIRRARKMYADKKGIGTKKMQREMAKSYIGCFDGYVITLVPVVQRPLTEADIRKPSKKRKRR